MPLPQELQDEYIELVQESRDKLYAEFAADIEARPDYLPCIRRLADRIAEKKWLQRRMRREKKRRTIACAIEDGILPVIELKSDPTLALEIQAFDRDELDVEYFSFDDI